MISIIECSEKFLIKLFVCLTASLHPLDPFILYPPLNSHIYLHLLCSTAPDGLPCRVSVSFRTSYKIFAFSNLLYSPNPANTIQLFSYNMYLIQLTIFIKSNLHQNRLIRLTHIILMKRTTFTTRNLRYSESQQS